MRSQDPHEPEKAQQTVIANVRSIFEMELFFPWGDSQKNIAWERTKS